ncbi:unnamed protein product [Phaedon cochleariae]|uniref:Cytochrome P450 n=1 Tax=Phaedon cochleariae TaxID=80249 RepID=A0A9N9SJY8_PHACE|nr:unnamed protein product [Phaedon cochleariae]
MIFSTWLALLVGAIGALFLLNYIYNWIRFMRLMDRLPGPKPLPILRHLLDLFCEQGEFWRRLRKWSKDYGPMYNLAAMHFPSVNISGPEEFEVIASTMKHIEKADVYLFLRRWLGEGLLTSTGSHWQTRRKILTPAFHFSILQQFVTVFNKETDRLVEVLKKETSKPWTDAMPLISEFTLYTITETSMGTKLNMQNQEDKDYVSSIYEIGKLLFYRMLRPWLYVSPIYYNLTPFGLKERKLIKVLHRFTDKIISQKSKDFQKFDVPQENYNYSQRKKLAFLDLLLNAKISEGIIDENGIRDEVNTFMFEGHDTTSTSICFTLMLLANHKDYQEKVYEEMVTVLGETNHPTIPALNDLKVMERVIKESLRLYPSVPFIGRTLEEDTLINGYLLPRRVHVNVHIFDIHRNEKYWPEPDRFDPDRFLPENCVDRHTFAYVPFSAGPRNCIGQKFAILEMKAVLCGILRNFELDPIDTPDSVVLVPSIILRTHDQSLKLKFKSRNAGDKR